MKAVVLGGTGHIGTYLVPMLVKAGFETVSVTRSNSAPYEDDPAWRKAQKLQLNRTDPDFVEKIAALEPDILVDLISFSVKDTEKMVEALSKSGCSHYLYCSSCRAHGRAELLPFDPDSLDKDPLDEYGKDKFASEIYLKEAYRKNGFPATIIMPGQISGPGWKIINPWGNDSLRVFQDIANGREIALPNFGMETIHPVHAKDVAQVFFKAILHRNQALGETFYATSGQAITLYGYAKHVYRYFGKDPRIRSLPWPEWCTYEGCEKECSHSFCHLARSGYISIDKEKKLLDYQPQYTSLETIDIALDSYLNPGWIQTSRNYE